MQTTYDELLALVEAMREENAWLKVRVDELERELAAAKKNSGNSSKPPSSDIAKPPKGKPKGRAARKGGGDASASEPRPPPAPSRADPSSATSKTSSPRIFKGSPLPRLLSDRSDVNGYLYQGSNVVAPS